MSKFAHRVAYETSAALVWLINKCDEYYVWFDMRGKRG